MSPHRRSEKSALDSQGHSSSAALRMRISRRNEQGFEAFVLNNEALEVVLVPALGAKIISLRNLKTGYEWMWHPPSGLKLNCNRLGDHFAASTMTGWDECLPTIAPCFWKGRELPDHGEVWSVPWAIDLDAVEQGALKTSVKLAISPFRFERSLSLSGNNVRLSYQLENLGDQPEEFIWCMHPLLPVNDEVRFLLTVETRMCLTGEEWTQVLTFGDKTPAFGKAHCGPLIEGRAGVVNLATRDRLDFKWDTRQNDTVGLWLTRGGWNGYHHLAVEPASGAPDSLIQAAAAGRCRVIQPKQRLRWQIKMSVR